MNNYSNHDMSEQTDHDLLIRLDQKVDTLHDKVSVLTDDHEERIRTLEDSKAEGKGAQKVWSAVSGVIGAGLALAAQYFIQHK